VEQKATEIATATILVALALTVILVATKIGKAKVEHTEAVAGMTIVNVV
jgi:hypothetical protein